MTVQLPLVSSEKLYAVNVRDQRDEGSPLSCGFEKLKQGARLFGNSVSRNADTFFSCVERNFAASCLSSALSVYPAMTSGMPGDDPEFAVCGSGNEVFRSGNALAARICLPNLRRVSLFIDSSLKKSFGHVVQSNRVRFYFVSCWCVTLKNE